MMDCHIEHSIERFLKEVGRLKIIRDVDKWSSLSVSLQLGECQSLGLGPYLCNRDRFESCFKMIHCAEYIYTLQCKKHTKALIESKTAELSQWMYHNKLNLMKTKQNSPFL